MIHRLSLRIIVGYKSYSWWDWLVISCEITDLPLRYLLDIVNSLELIHRSQSIDIVVVYLVVSVIVKTSLRVILTKFSVLRVRPVSACTKGSLGSIEGQTSWIALVKEERAFLKLKLLLRMWVLGYMWLIGMMHFCTNCTKL